MTYKLKTVLVFVFVSITSHFNVRVPFIGTFLHFVTCCSDFLLREPFSDKMYPSYDFIPTKQSVRDFVESQPKENQLCITRIILRLRTNLKKGMKYFSSHLLHPVATWPKSTSSIFILLPNSTVLLNMYSSDPTEM